MSTNAAQPSDREVGPESALRRQIEGMHLVPHHDWKFEKGTLDTYASSSVIASSSTFIERVEEHSNTCANRSPLLDSYRETVRLLDSNGRPLNPFAL